MDKQESEIAKGETKLWKTGSSTVLTVPSFWSKRLLLGTKFEVRIEKAEDGRILLVFEQVVQPKQDKKA
jgi:hypothetical protein